MTLHLKMPAKANNLSPKISVIGIGGAGGNIINSMIDYNVSGVSFLNVNTDSQQLKHSKAEETLQLGPNCTQGLGAGADPDVGKASAEEVVNEIQEYLDDANMVFLTAGMGGGTGTGASPVVARVARDMGILIVGVVTKPFEMEGKVKMQRAEEGIRELQKYVDNLIVIPNQNIFHSAKPETTFTEALQLANNVLIDGVRSIIDLMVKPGIMNHDYSDVRAVMSETGKVHMGTGIAEDNERSLKATEEAILNPLLENNSMSGARGVLVNITGGEDVTLLEVDQALHKIKEESDENANIIWGITKDEAYSGKFKISVISTGIDSETFGNRIKTENEIKIDNVDTIIEENSNNESSVPKFLVELENPKLNEEYGSNQGTHELKIKELEDKAKEFKEEEEEEEEEKKIESSFFERIFGKKKNKDENKISNIDKNVGVFDDQEKAELDRMDGERSLFDSKRINEKSNLNLDKDIEEGPLDSDEISVKTSDDELLQIPAFLRRQAN